jgi:hypothetical protein
VARDGGSRESGAAAERWSCRVLLDLAPLGRVVARVELAARSIAARLLVEREEARALLQREIGSLAPALADAGFVTAQVTVGLDPLAVDGEFAPRDPPPAGGSLLSVRA